MVEYQKYWNRKMETLSEEESHSVQEKAFLSELKYVWKNSIFYQIKFEYKAKLVRKLYKEEI